MAKHRMCPPGLYEGDGTETRAVINWLMQHKVPFIRCSRYHLKVQSLNYYIGKGTLFCDGDLAAQDERGVEAFKKHLTRLSFSTTGGVTDFAF